MERLRKMSAIGFVMLFYLSLFAGDFKCYKREKTGWAPAAAIESLLKYYGVEVSQKEVIKGVTEGKKVPVYKVVSFLEGRKLEPFSFRGSVEVLDRLLDRGIPVLLLQWASDKVKKGYLRVAVKGKKGKYYLCEPCAGKLIKVKRKELEKLWGGEGNWALVVKGEGLGIEEDEYYYRDRAFAAVFERAFARAKGFLQKAMELGDRSFYNRVLTCIEGRDEKCLRGWLRKAPYAELFNKKEEDDFIAAFLALFVAATN